MNDFRGQSIDAVLRELLKQGRLDAGGAEKLATQGMDRLRTFLAGDPTAAPTTTTPGSAPAAEVVEDDVPAGIAETGTGTDGLEEAEVVADGFLEHTVPLRGGRYAHVVVPEGFTRADADRIAGVLAALALDPEDPDPADAGR